VNLRADQPRLHARDEVTEHSKAATTEQFKSGHPGWEKGDVGWPR
jgi:hypothetical protein